MQIEQKEHLSIPADNAPMKIMSYFCIQYSMTKEI